MLQIRKRLINVCVEKTPRQEQEWADGFIRVEVEHSQEITRKDLFDIAIKIGLYLLKQRFFCLSTPAKLGRLS